jgi:serine/threonine-protein phosphatase 2A activator
MVLFLNTTNGRARKLHMAEKKIVSRAHLDAFLNSQTHTDVVDFVEALNEASIGVSLRDECFESDVSLQIVRYISHLQIN